jgi:hypothetical protein
MKKWSIVLLMSFITVGCFAQVQRNVAAKKDSTEMAMQDEKIGDDEFSKKGSRREMMRSLNLSKEQKQKFKEIHQANKAKKESIESNGQLTESQKKDQLKELHKEAAANMKDILSEEQINKVKEMRKGKRG